MDEFTAEGINPPTKPECINIAEIFKVDVIIPAAFIPVHPAPDV